MKLITAEVPSTPTTVLTIHFLGSEAAAFYVEGQATIRLGGGGVALVNSREGGAGKYSKMPFAIGTAGIAFGRRGAGKELQLWMGQSPKYVSQYLVLFFHDCGGAFAERGC